ncbi:helix-turn-helix domain-containing protein, partial [Streptomyces roseolus]
MPKDAAVEEFARLVRALKARDGRSYEALGRRLSVSASTLHRYCSGVTVPEDFAVVDRLAALCGADEEERRAVEEAWAAADLARRPPAPVAGHAGTTGVTGTAGTAGTARTTAPEHARVPPPAPAREPVAGAEGPPPPA